MSEDDTARGVDGDDVVECKEEDEDEQESTSGLRNRRTQDTIPLRARTLPEHHQNIAYDKVSAADLMSRQPAIIDTADTGAL